MPTSLFASCKQNDPAGVLNPKCPESLQWRKLRRSSSKDTQGKCLLILFHKATFS